MAPICCACSFSIFFSEEPVVWKTKELQMLSPSLFIQGSHCKGWYYCCQKRNQCLKCQLSGHKLSLRVFYGSVFHKCVVRSQSVTKEPIELLRGTAKNPPPRNCPLLKLVSHVLLCSQAPCRLCSTASKAPIAQFRAPASQPKLNWLLPATLTGLWGSVYSFTKPCRWFNSTSMSLISSSGKVNMVWQRIRKWATNSHVIHIVNGNLKAFRVH